MNTKEGKETSINFDSFLGDVDKMEKLSDIEKEKLR